MNLAQRYDALRRDAVRKLAQGGAEADALLDSPQDTRRGITLLVRPPAHIASAIAAMLAGLRRREPGQYYYPATDIHLTVLSLISCYRGFTLDAIDPAAYQAAVRSLLQNTPPFSITYAGLTASPGGIMAQGFPLGDGLQTMRNAIRAFFQSSGLQQSIDQRYSLETAHSTLVRFRSKPKDPNFLIQEIEKYRQHFIGTFEVNAVELVYNDWYQRAENTILLEKYLLNPDAWLPLQCSPDYFPVW